MTIAISCQCGHQYKLKAELAGKRIRCKECGSILNVPENAATPIETLSDAEMLAELDDLAKASPSVRKKRKTKPKPHAVHPESSLNWTGVRNGLLLICRGGHVFLWIILSLDLPMIVLPIAGAWTKSVYVPVDQAQYFPYLAGFVACVLAAPILCAIYYLAEEYFTHAVTYIGSVYLLLLCALKLPQSILPIAMCVSIAALAAGGITVAGLTYCLVGAQTKRTRLLICTSIFVAVLSGLFLGFVTWSVMPEIKRLVAEFAVTRTQPSSIQISTLTIASYCAHMACAFAAHILFVLFLVELAKENADESSVACVRHYLWFAVGRTVFAAAILIWPVIADSATQEVLVASALLLSLEIVGVIWFILTLQFTHDLIRD